ncbi:MAG: hypothetical protein KKB30_04140 [Proteobacteria bacterium]|nr:hypothetical protein [Pseudomonadota bacterium]MBU1714924.1 hypothetical protein [Pseudomonadota bacterium]
MGSNSFRLLVSQLSDSGLHPLHKNLRTVRLGQGLSQTSILTGEAIARGLAVLTDYKKILEQYQPVSIRACGTAALRIAENRTEFILEAEKILSVPIEIISGEEEAQLALRGTLSAFSNSESDKPFLIIDVGGGSTELIYLAKDNAHPTIQSIAVGAVTLTEKLARQQTAPVDLRPEFKDFFGKIRNARPLSIIATGGTATALAALDLGLKDYDGQIVQGHLLDIVHLDNIFNRLSQISPAERNLLPGLEQGRGDIIVAGIMIYKIILEHAEVQQMTISDSGLLEGIVLSQLPAYKINQATKYPADKDSI